MRNDEPDHPTKWPRWERIFCQGRLQMPDFRSSRALSGGCALDDQGLERVGGKFNQESLPLGSVDSLKRENVHAGTGGPVWRIVLEERFNRNLFLNVLLGKIQGGDRAEIGPGNAKQEDATGLVLHVWHGDQLAFGQAKFPARR